MSNERAPSHDHRWGDHVPWSLRYPAIVTKGDFRRFFSMLRERLYQLFLYNEPNISNVSHFGSRLASESLMRYRHSSETAFPLQIQSYFSPDVLDREANYRTFDDPEAKAVSKLQTEYTHASFPGAGYRPEQVEQLSSDLHKAKLADLTTKEKRQQAHWNAVVLDRLDVLQSLLLLLVRHGSQDALNSLQRDIRRFAADSGVSLDLRGNPPTIVPIEHPLLQKEVLDKLLPRLEASFPERAKDLTNAYHDLLKGTDANTVFGNAFKALEELARELTGNKNLILSDRLALDKHFTGLHPTIRDTIIKLAGHRGDEGGHGRKGPDEWETRYLLLAICNIALLLLECSEHSS